MLENALKTFGEDPLDWEKRLNHYRLQEGWTVSEEGYMIPPGWVRGGDVSVPSVERGGDDAPETFGDSV